VSTTLPTTERDLTEIRAGIDQAFGERVGLADRYAELLCTQGIERGMIGPREADRVWERHLLNSTSLASLIPLNARVIDLGSGAGLPGIPLAISRPDLTVVLLEPMQRRVSFLNDCLELLQLPGVSVHHGRAEDGIPTLADVVVVRAVAPLAKLLELSLGLLVPGGTLLALKGQRAADELGLARRQATVDAEILTIPAPGQPARVIRATRPAPVHPTAGSTRAARRSR
jgi:16S rRNA (guanine527-N7)-methyltransferase